MLEAVVDTNVLISGLLKGSTRAVINALLEERFRLVISDELLNELVFVMRKPKLSAAIPSSDCELLIALIKEKARFNNPRFEVKACRDIKDNMVLSCALASKSCLVTGDKDLLSLSPFKGAEILTPRAFLKILNKS